MKFRYNGATLRSYQIERGSRLSRGRSVHLVDLGGLVRDLRLIRRNHILRRQSQFGRAPVTWCLAHLNPVECRRQKREASRDQDHRRDLVLVCRRKVSQA